MVVVVGVVVAASPWQMLENWSASEPSVAFPFFWMSLSLHSNVVFRWLSQLFNPNETCQAARAVVQDQQAHQVQNTQGRRLDGEALRGLGKTNTSV